MPPANPKLLPAARRDGAAPWERTLYAFLGEKERRSGSPRTVDSYARLLWPFFERAGSPETITPAHVLAWAHGLNDPAMYRIAPTNTPMVPPNCSASEISRFMFHEPRKWVTQIGFSVDASRKFTNGGQPPRNPNRRTAEIGSSARRPEWQRAHSGLHGSMNLLRGQEPVATGIRNTGSIADGTDRRRQRREVRDGEASGNEQLCEVAQRHHLPGPERSIAGRWR